MTARADLRSSGQDACAERPEFEEQPIGSGQRVLATTLPVLVVLMHLFGPGGRTVVDHGRVAAVSAGDLAGSIHGPTCDLGKAQTAEPLEQAVLTSAPLASWNDSTAVSLTETLKAEANITTVSEENLTFSAEWMFNGQAKKLPWIGSSPSFR